MSATWYVPTNRQNMLGMFSRGLVCGPEGLDKYEPDVMRFAPGRLVLVDGPAPEWLLNLSPGDTPQTYPVLLELELSQEPEPVVMDASGLRAAAPAWVLPTHVVRAVHVRSDREQREILARSFANVSGDKLPLSVTPDLFSGGTPGNPTDLERALTELAVPETGGQLRGLDAIAGALVLAAQACSSSALVERLADLLRTWTEKVVSPDQMVAALLGIEPGDTSDDFRLGSATASLLKSQPGRDVLVPSEFLESVRDALPGDIGERLGNQLDRVAGILRSEISFTRFRDGASSPALKSLLLFLVRSDPSDVLTWSADETAAAPPIMALAAAYSGLAHGFRLIPSELRRPALLCDLVTRSLAGHLSGEDGLVAAGLGGEAPPVDFDRVTQQRGILKIGSEAVLDVEDPPEPPAPIDPAELDEPMAVLLARELGWVDIIALKVSADSVSLAASGRKVVATFAGAVRSVEEVDRVVLAERLREVDQAKARAVISRAQSAEAPQKRRTASRRKADTPASPELFAGETDGSG